MMRITFTLILMLVLMAGCYYESEEQLYSGSGTPCDTASVTYSGTIKPILATNCLACHNSGDYNALGGGNNLEEFSTLRSLAEQGTLMKAVTHQAGYSPMPKGGEKLDTCTIQKISKWIENGAQNN
jgi:mono/diheme cytochrome c family protein